MITERELDQLITDPLIQRAARHVRPLGVASYRTANRSEHALALWVAVLTRKYLKSIRTASDPLVERIWKFSEGQADIDMRVGVNGAYRKFKVTTEMSGPTSLRLRIVSWDSSGQAETPWERYGSYLGGPKREGIETLPIR